MGNYKIEIDIGKTFQSKYDGEYTIINLIDEKYVEIEFAETGQVQYCYKDLIGRTKLRDWSKPQVYGVGYSSGDREHPDCHTYYTNQFAFHTWQNMIIRCFNGAFRGYKKVAVEDSWRDFRNFLKWYDENYCDKCELDKDLFSPPGYKRYSPETCCFLPSDINQWLRNYLKYVNGDVEPKFPIERIIMPLADMLVKYHDTFTPRAEQRLWEICERYGFTNANFADRKTLSGLKHSAIELETLKANIKRQRENEVYVNKVAKDFPLVGFVEYKRSVIRIKNFKDLADLYKKCMYEIIFRKPQPKTQ